MQVLLIHQGFVSPNDSGGTRHFELGRRAIEQGHRFTVVASDVRYFTGQRMDRSHKLNSEEIVEGIRVIRAYTYPGLHGSFVGRLLSFISFAFTSVWAALRVEKVDIVMGTSPPIFQAASAWLVAALRRRPFLLEIRDLWPAFVIDMGFLKNPLLIRLSRWLEHFLYRRATHLLVNSPAYVDYLKEKGVPPEKITLLANGVDPAMFDPAADGAVVRRKLNLDGKFVVVYAGVMGPANSLDVLLDAAAELRADERFFFLLVGDGKARKQLQAQAESLQLENVSFVSAQPKTEMRYFLGSADACVAILQNIRMFRMTYPNKVFDYMAAGRPIVLAIDGVIREVVEAARAGIFVPPGNAKSLAEAVRYLADHRDEREAMGRRARSYVESHFNRADQSRQFITLLDKVATQQ
jgi:glycosyltransferase involved in cell wall biosynthesis